MPDHRVKIERLKKNIEALGSAAVAFSGGVDSSFLAAVAHEVLGERAVAVTARSSVFPKRELAEARKFTKDRGIRHIIFDFSEFEIEGFAGNPPDRCYHCKTSILKRMRRIAVEEKLSCVIEGSNVDDEGDYRPGSRAVREQGIRSPLKEAGLTKEEIRELSREMGLPTWKKQSAACLASRFAYGEPITEEKLLRVEKAEDYLRDRGFGQLRVRIHGELARIELTENQLARALELRRELTGIFRELGFSYITLDLQGYRTGSMNEVLNTTDSDISSQEPESCHKDPEAR